MQKEFAKNPDADCATHHPIDYYQQLAATPKGLQELAFLKCQLQARSEWHTRRAQELQAKGETGTNFSNEVAMGMRCTTEGIAVMNVMQKAGGVAATC